MKNTLLVCALALSALSFPSFAQEGKEVEWYNVTALNFFATGGKDQSHALQQYLLFDRKVHFVDYDGKLDVFDKSFNLVRTENRD